MLQRVSFGVRGRDVDGIFHIPDGPMVGSAVVLHGFGGNPDQPHVLATCAALEAAGVAALRFAFRDHEPPRMTLDSGLEDAKGALGIVAAHPRISHELAIVGFSFGGAVAALAAGGRPVPRAAVLCAAPATFKGDDRALERIARTKAQVLLLWGSRDAVVPFSNAERYRDRLAAAKVTHELRTIEGGDHDFAPAGPRAAMATAVAGFVVAALTKPSRR